MTTETVDSDAQLRNMQVDDELAHSNVLMVYGDQQDSPSCTAAFVGHLLR